MVPWETFPALSSSKIRHGFSRRFGTTVHKEVDDALAQSIAEQGFPFNRAVTGQQTHGNAVALVDEKSNSVIPEVDALITRQKNRPLIVRVADCGPVFIYDPIHEAIAVAHSGKKGTALNIVKETIAAMAKHFGSQPKDLIVQLGPCIRPPHYEIDFASEIGRQAKAEGVTHFYDCGTCTASNPTDYYSYRAEKGKTGRMWGVLMLV